MSAPARTVAPPVFALLADGTTVEISEVSPGDEQDIRRLHRELSAESVYLRFFSIGRDAGDRVAARIARPPALEGEPDHGALVARLGGSLVGVANYEPTGEPGTAEVALAVADYMHHRGVGTLLLEHLGGLARSRGVLRFRADVLAQNFPMQRMLADAGLRLERRLRDGVVEAVIPLEVDDHYLDVVSERESRADVASLIPLLRPRSVAIVGASRRPDSVGAAVLGNTGSFGFTGTLYAVNPHAGDRLGGVPCYPSVAALPEPPDLAVVTVPARAVVEVARDCGERGVRALVVITSGLTEQDGHDLLAVCRKYGMRLVGPNCFGVANTSPEVRLDTTFAAEHPVAGSAGLVVQSGGVGVALIEHLSRLGIGVSTFASVGDKYDVSSNDMLQWWESDGDTRLAVLYVESFGNPRKFARTARRVGRRLPILTVLAGRSAAGQRAAASHTAAAATPEVTREALFGQAGIVTTRSLGELVEAAALFVGQPVPEGPRVAVVSNAGGAGVLTADACADAGLVVAALPERVQHALAATLPPGSACANPVDTTAAATRQQFRKALCLLAEAAEVDALIVVVVPTALGDLRPVITEVAAVAARQGKPLAAAELGQPEAIRLLTPPGGSTVPSYAAPECAARALGHAWSYSRRRARPAGRLPRFDDLRTADAAGIVRDFLDAEPEGGWLPAAAAMDLLECYGLPMTPWRSVTSAEQAARAAAEIGGPVAVKADVPGVVHKSEAGAVELGLDDPEQARLAYARFTRRFGDRLRGAIVQAMGAPGVEVIAGVVQEPVFGPLMIFGLGGVATEALGDSAARLAPLTDVDAAELVRGLRAAPLLLGYRDKPPVDLAGLEQVLLRLSQLAADLPAVAELDLNPVIARPDGVLAVDARVRLVPAQAWDPYLRRLR